MKPLFYLGSNICYKTTVKDGIVTVVPVRQKAADMLNSVTSNTDSADDNNLHTSISNALIPINKSSSNLVKAFENPIKNATKKRQKRRVLLPFPQKANAQIVENTGCEEFDERTMSSENDTNASGIDSCCNSSSTLNATEYMENQAAQSTVESSSAKDQCFSEEVSILNLY